MHLILLRFTVLLAFLLFLSGCGEEDPAGNTSSAPTITRGSDVGVDVLDEYDLKGGAGQVDRYTRIYDPATVITLQGAVIDKEVVELENDEPTMVIELASGGDFTVVALAPEGFLDRHLTIRLSDQVQVTGSSVVVGGRRIVVARSIRKGDNSVSLREESGRPLWTTNT